jgi:3'-5' exoribonuclease
MGATKPRLERLRDLTPGTRADFFALLIERTRGITREGRPYYHCRFRDAARTVAFMAWVDDRWFAPCENDWREGTFYKLRAIFGEHERYGPQIDLLAIREVVDADRDDGFEEADFVESTPHAIAVLWAEAIALAKENIDDEPLRDLVLDVLESPADAFQRLPASRDRAYPYRGGLLEHVVAVTRLVLELADRYTTAWPEMQPPLDRGLLVAAALLHDIGRLRELSDDWNTQPTLAGRLFGPGLLARDMVREASRDRPLSVETQTLLEHLLLCPHAKEPPVVPEGVLLVHADRLDLEFAQCARLLQRDPAKGPFTERDPGLGRALYKQRETRAASEE